ncbi:polymerase delta-interacting protein 3 isoform X2 [Clupea harengus]|uniref:Polymerase delta-interacting protein 3 isoform X2 n=1 Tax=Clupea harengus TaxID=7950 RepID=A0A6P3VV60_CLUHA|nr:polymerase delta-interacting protein 3 isoform X2 [Clupea harengus]
MRNTCGRLQGMMADLSLDELIRRRGLNTKGAVQRPAFGRMMGTVGRTFDARQKIGAADVRQRLGSSGQTGPGSGFQVKDAREKIGQKDARFRIRGRGGATGGVQDARQMINSRKQQGPNPVGNPLLSHKPLGMGLQATFQIYNNNGATNASARQFPSTFQGLNVRAGLLPQPSGGIKKVVDARDRLSLKRSITGAAPTMSSQTPLKITKTIQQRPIGMVSDVRFNVPSRGAQSLLNDDDVILNKQMKITTANNMAQTRPGGIGSSFSMSGPITKVVRNDAYTAPPPPVPTPPARSTAAPPVATGQVRGHGHGQQAADTSARPAPPPQPTFSPLEGTKITVNNLHPRVTEEDIVELFCVCGALKRARLVKQGVAEVVFVKKDDAISAYRKYNNRCLDGQPMKCNLHMQGNVITSDQPILLRLSDTPGAGGGARKDGLPASLTRPGGRPASSQPAAEVDPQTILKALFKSSGQTPTTTEPPNSQATAFRIKI